VSGTVLVTGAGGFIGKHVCQCLAGAGWSVRAAVRSGEPPPDAVCFHLPAARDGRVLRDLVRGCDAVVHLAGRAHVLRETAADPRAEFRASNTELTRTLAEAAVTMGVGTFVLMSSVAAASNAHSGTVRDDVTDAPDTDYGVSKWEAENALDDVAHGTDLRAVALRPPMVYGEGMRGNPLSLFRHLARGLPLPVLRPAVRRSMMYAGNLAEAVAVTLAHTGVRGRFCVTDSAAVAIDAFAGAAAAALGRPARLVPVPAWALRLAGTIGEVAGHALPVRVDRDAVARLSQSLVVDGTRFARLAEFTPRYSQREGVERTARWLVDGGNVTRHGLARGLSPAGLR
jgi:nucleoside-diphosphate-sugar epimerase